MSDLELSRATATAAMLANVASDATMFFTKPVLLTGEKHTLSTANGRDCFRSALLLLLRMTTEVTIDVSNYPLPSEIQEIVDEYGIHKLTVIPETPPFSSFPAILNVGTDTAPQEPIVAVNAHGWLFRVTSGGVPIDRVCSQYNPIAALAAAAMGVSEIFKILIKLQPSRGEFLRGYSYSLWEYGLSDQPGPELPLNIDLPPTVLFGCGAIGNGIVYLLRLIAKAGEFRTVDKDVFKKENLGTCLILKPTDLGKSKSDVLAQELTFATSFPHDVNAFKSKPGVPQVCLNGLDNIEARRQVQELWPDIAIDGAIGPLSCEVTLHPWGPDLSCLLCDFEEANVSAVEEAKLITGLTAERLQNQTSLVSNYDVEHGDEKKEWLRARIGRPICSVVSEAELEKLSKEKFENRFRPSVPFVACLSAAMVITEFLRYLMKEPPVLATGFQFDVLVGPHNGIKKEHSRKASCLCVTRQPLIEKLRRKRSERLLPLAGEHAA